MPTYAVVDGIGIISPGTERIEEKAFYSNKDLKSIVIPDSVTEIGPEAFAFCSALTDVRFSNSLEKICHDAFRECALTKVQLPASLKYVTGFFKCTSLSEVTLPDHVEVIGRDAFRECPISSINLPSSLKKILLKLDPKKRAFRLSFFLQKQKAGS